MADATNTIRSRFWLSPVRFIGLIVPQRLAAGVGSGVALPRNFIGRMGQAELAKQTRSAAAQPGRVPGCAAVTTKKIGGRNVSRFQNHVFSSVAAFTSDSFNLTGAGEPERINGTLTSASLFPLLHVQPALGRAFLDEEDRPGHDQVAILSYGLWQRRFAGNSAVIGQRISLNGQSHTVVGVMPAGFQFSGDTTEIWKPIAFTALELRQCK